MGAMTMRLSSSISPTLSGSKSVVIDSSLKFFGKSFRRRPKPPPHAHSVHLSLMDSFKLSGRLGPQLRPLTRFHNGGLKNERDPVGDYLSAHEEGRIGAGEEEHRLGDLFGPPEPLQRHLLAEALLRLFRKPH